MTEGRCDTIIAIKGESCGFKRISNQGNAIADLQLFDEYNQVLIQGILKTVFGEPLYETNDYENAYSYVIKATESSLNLSFQFEVYQGSSGCAIGGQGRSLELNKAISDFKQLLLSIKPSDYLYEGYYMDAHMKIRCGMSNGNIIYEEIALDDDEIEEMYKELGLH